MSPTPTKPASLRKESAYSQSKSAIRVNLFKISQKKSLDKQHYLFNTMSNGRKHLFRQRCQAATKSVYVCPLQDVQKDKSPMITSDFYLCLTARTIVFKVALAAYMFHIDFTPQSFLTSYPSAQIMFQPEAFGMHFGEILTKERVELFMDINIGAANGIP